jgi:hypothetical protein
MSILNVPVKEVGMAGSAIANDDYITMYLQGSTQWDSLAHVGYDNCFYNNVPTSAVTAHGGAAKNDIGKLYQSFVTRGVLLDMVRYKGYEKDGHLPKDYPITVADLDGCAQSQKVEVRSGDALCVRTGWVPTGTHSRHMTKKPTSMLSWHVGPYWKDSEKKSLVLRWTTRWNDSEIDEEFILSIRLLFVTWAYRWELTFEDWRKIVLRTVSTSSCGAAAQYSARGCSR